MGTPRVGSSTSSPSTSSTTSSQAAQAAQAAQEAERAIRAAQEAARQAAEARARANAAQSTFEKSPTAGTLDQYNYQARSDAATADKAAIDATNTAEQKMLQANEAARGAGKAEPFAIVSARNASDRSSFEPGTGKASLTGATATFSPEAVRLNLQADQSYAKLKSDPATARTLDSLKITDGESLRSFGANAASGNLSLVPGLGAAVDQAKKTQPAAYQTILESAQATTAAPIPGATAAGAAATPEAAAAAVHQAKDDYNKAHDKAKELDQKLGGELNKLGASMTPDQKTQYIKAFHDKYKDAYDADATAEASLSKAINDPQLDAAVQKDPKLAYEVADSAKALAGTSHSAEVLQWASHAFDPANPASAAYEKVKEPLTTPGPRGMPIQTHDAINLADDIVGPSLSGAAGELSGQSGGDAKLALAKYKDLISGLKGSVKGAFEAQGGQKLLSSIDQAVSSGNLSGLASDFTNVKGKVGYGLGAAGVIFAGLSAKTAAEKGDYASLVQDLAVAGRGGTEILAGGLHAFTTAGSVAAVDGIREAGVLDRLAPGLGVIANAIQLGKDGSDFVNDPSLGHGLAAVGDLVSLVGSGVAVAVPGLGQLIEGVGFVISGIGNLITGNEEKDKLNSEETDLLKQAGLDPAVADTLGKSDDQANMLAKDLKMSPTDIQTLAKNHSELFQAPGYMQAAIDAAKACGLQGGDVNTFVDGLAKDNPDYLDVLFTQLENKGTGGAVHDDALRSMVDNQFPTAAALAHAKSPQLFGQAGELRGQADRDYEMSGSSDPGQLGNLFKQNPDPAYQAELIKRIKDDGRLDFFAETFSNSYHYNGWNEAALGGLEAAKNAGVITQQEFDKYSPGLR